jgi:hypothetical protein
MKKDVSMECTLEKPGIKNPSNKIQVEISAKFDSQKNLQPNLKKVLALPIIGHVPNSTYSS